MFRTLLCVMLFAALSWAADVTGTWTFAVETEMGSGSPTFVFKQDGEKLTGTYAGQLGEAKLAGTVRGNQIEFVFEVSPGGDPIKVKYTGTLEDSKRVKGTIDFGGLGKGTFTGTRN